MVIFKISEFSGSFEGAAMKKVQYSFYTYMKIIGAPDLKSVGRVSGAFFN